MQSQIARQERIDESRDESRSELVSTEIDALLVATSSVPAAHVAEGRKFGPLDGILIAAGVGGLVWALGIGALVLYLR